MRLGLTVAVVLCAFAANSVLNRLALAGHSIGPGSFALIRLASGALALSALVFWRDGRLKLLGPGRGIGVASLGLYMLGFSFAYLSLPAGTGALILFGGVQITMFGAALLRGEPLPLLRWVGAGVALFGLVLLLWPNGAAAPDLTGAVLMAAAAAGWGIYSLNGQRAGDPLNATAANFFGAVPLAILALVAFPDGVAASGTGVGYAVLAGVVTSGFGYALWYLVLPRLTASVAAVSQLTVPVLAVCGGAVLLGEPLTGRLLLASCVVLGGVALSLWRFGGRPKAG